MVAPLPGRHRNHTGDEPSGGGAAQTATGDSRERQRGRKEGDETQLTPDAMPTLARTGEA